MLLNSKVIEHYSSVSWLYVKLNLWRKGLDAVISTQPLHFLEQLWFTTIIIFLSLLICKYLIYVNKNRLRINSHSNLNGLACELLLHQMCRFESPNYSVLSSFYFGTFIGLWWNEKWKLRAEDWGRLGPEEMSVGT